MYTPKPEVTFTADHVWGLAVIADRMNGGYNRYPTYDTEGVKTGEANKDMVKGWLRDGTMQPSEQDIAEGQKYRAYFGGFTLKALSGKINDFERQALKIAGMDTFSGRNMLEFAVISCLPSVARRDAEAVQLKREVFTSTQLVGQTGDTVIGEIEVINCRFVEQYVKNRITARMGESFIDFWHGKSFVKGATVKIKGKIKAVRGDKTTQLNYVKVVDK